MSSILIVDPHDLLCDALIALLHSEGYATNRAVTVTSALELLDAYTYDLVLTSLFSDSFERRFEPTVPLRERAAPTPVGVLTGWPVSAEDVRALGLAFAHRKPFNIDRLLTDVAAAIQAPLSGEGERCARVVRAYFEALSARDWDALGSLCAEDVIYVLPGSGPFSTTVQGREAFRDFSAETFRQFPGARFDHVRVYSAPHGLAARYEARWRAEDGGEHELQQAGAVIFRFSGVQISQIGIRLNDARLQALLEA